jgi:cell division protein FtsB
MLPETGIEFRRSTGPEPLRRQRVERPPSSILRRRGLQLLLIFVTLVLIIDALIGDKGLTESMNARRQYRELQASLDGLRRENAALRKEVQRLNEDPAAIESLARQELGLIKPGEIVFILKDLKDKDLKDGHR